MFLLSVNVDYDKTPLASLNIVILPYYLLLAYTGIERSTGISFSKFPLKRQKSNQWNWIVLLGWC